VIGRDTGARISTVRGSVSSCVNTRLRATQHESHVSQLCLDYIFSIVQCLDPTAKLLKL
jgi:hypothetical protein